MRNFSEPTRRPTCTGGTVTRTPGDRVKGNDCLRPRVGTKEGVVGVPTGDRGWREKESVEGTIRGRSLR